MSTKPWAAHLTAAAVVALWGITFVSSKVLLNAGLMPADIFFYRFLMAYVLMLVFSHRRLLAHTLQEEAAFLLLGMMGGSLYFLTENMALQHTAASNVSILISSTPMLTALLVGTFYLTERLSRRQIFGSLLAFAGMALVVLNGQLVLRLNPLGDALAFLSALTWAFYSLFITMVKNRYPPDFITRKVFFYGLLTILPYFLFVRPLSLDLQLLARPVVWGNLLFLGLLASTGAYLLWNWTLARLGTVRATNYIYAQPLVTMLFAVLILGERITPMALVGTAVLILGMTRINA